MVCSLYERDPFQIDYNRRMLPTSISINYLFEEAQTVFVQSDMPELMSGPGAFGRGGKICYFRIWLQIKILVVCHCYKSKNEVIRIISARKAMKKEEKTYMELL